MALPDELERLAELHQRGVLSDDEFARAKARVMGETLPQRSKMYRSPGPTKA